MNQNDFWNERYAQPEYIYGEKPNEFLKSKLAEISGQKILFPAEGEGRNAVFAAENGWEVFAFDPSESGKKKAETLAKQKNVSLNYEISDVENIHYSDETFDALVLIYAHFHSDFRRDYHRKLNSFLKKDGILILEAFSKNHIENQAKNPSAGGPKNRDMLYDLEEIKQDFENFEFMEAEERMVHLEEGRHHLGEAEVIRVFAKKKIINIKEKQI